VRQVSRTNGKSIFADGSENDFTEFLTFIVEIIHQIMSRKLVVTINRENITNKIGQKCAKTIRELYNREYSEIISMFYGLTYSTIYSKKTGKLHSVNCEPFLILDLPISLNECSLEQCIQHYILPEELSGENAWYNEKTNEKEDVIKKINFWSFPNILIISLKRFTNEHKTLVRFPLTDFDLNNYISEYKCEDSIYDLYAVANHFGNIDGGHYTALVKIKEQWIHFDDKITTIVDNVITPFAYCLFYVKKNYL
jgi:ubiquitin carboxyl-terminal hydrolase 8